MFNWIWNSHAIDILYNIDFGSMKKIITLVALAAGAFSKFSSELTTKYSIEVLNEGKEGT